MLQPAKFLSFKDMCNH